MYTLLEQSAKTATERAIVSGTWLECIDRMQNILYGAAYLRVPARVISDGRSWEIEYVGDPMQYVIHKSDAPRCAYCGEEVWEEGRAAQEPPFCSHECAMLYEEEA